MANYEKAANDTMAKAIQYLKDELRGVRTGRASPGLVEHIRIDVPSYGSTMELRELASITDGIESMIATDTASRMTRFAHAGNRGASSAGADASCTIDTR